MRAVLSRVGLKGVVWTWGQELAYSPKRAQSDSPLLSLSILWTLAGEQTKALVTQLTLFNQILVELRDDIRDQVWVGQPRRLLTLGWGGGCGGLTAPPSAGEGDVPHPEHHHGVSGVR